MPACENYYVHGCAYHQAKRPDILFPIFPAPFDTRLAWLHAIRCDKAFTAPFFSSVMYRYCGLLRSLFCKDDYPQFPVDDDLKPKKRWHRLMKGSVPSVFSFRPPPKPVQLGKEDGLAVGAARTAELETKN